jgi:hypothetical protein
MKVPLLRSLYDYLRDCADALGEPFNLRQDFFSRWLQDGDPSSLTLETEGSLRVVWVPFAHSVPKSTRLVIVGITPGRHQAEAALSAFRKALLEGRPLSEASQLAMQTGGFAGPMRTNLVKMLDAIGAPRVLHMDSCAEMFTHASVLVYGTSALRHAVFVNGKNYSGAPEMLDTPMLRRMIDNYLAAEAGTLPNDALWIPLGPKPAIALGHLAENGVLDPSRILAGMPHPSGANNGRIAYFLGTKQPPPDAIFRAREKLRTQIAAL